MKCDKIYEVSMSVLVMEVHTGDILSIFKWEDLCKAVGVLSYTWKDLNRY